MITNTFLVELKDLLHKREIIPGSRSLVKDRDLVKS